MSLIDLGGVVVSSKRFSKLDFWRELLIATRFGLVGIVATAVHIMVVWLLLKQTRITPISANTLAFLLAFGISFAGNYVWTFRSPGSMGRAMFRFFLIAVSAFAANTLVLALLMQEGGFSPVGSAILSASVVPVISFAASRLWGFEGNKSGVNGDSK